MGIEYLLIYNNKRYHIGTSSCKRTFLFRYHDDIEIEGTIHKVSKINELISVIILATSKGGKILKQNELMCPDNLGEEQDPIMFIDFIETNGIISKGYNTYREGYQITTDTEGYQWTN